MTIIILIYLILEFYSLDISFHIYKSYFSQAIVAICVYDVIFLNLCK